MGRRRENVKPSQARQGITLLEVLISCGLLVIGLSAMAAMLPAAGSRLAQASIEDRASVTASNALAELKNRGLLSAAAFGDPARVLSLGMTVGDLPGFSDGAVSGGDWFTVPAADAARRLGSPRVFQLEDDLAYDTSQLVATPLNAFGAGEGQAVGPRRYRPGICWGATLAPRSFPAVSGGAAVLSVPIFKKLGGAAAMQTLVLTKTHGYYEADLISPGALLRACSWVVAIPVDASEAPAWFKVMASWVLEPPASQVPRIVLRDQAEFERLTGSGSQGQQATVIAFEGLVRVDEHDVILD